MVYVVIISHVDGSARIADPKCAHARLIDGMCAYISLRPNNHTIACIDVCTRVSQDKRASERNPDHTVVGIDLSLLRLEITSPLAHHIPITDENGRGNFVMKIDTLKYIKKQAEL